MGDDRDDLADWGEWPDTGAVTWRGVLLALVALSAYLAFMFGVLRPIVNVAQP